MSSRPTHSLALRYLPRLAASLLLASTLTGCSGWHFGADSLYRQDINTVYVPVFESDSYRRFLGEQLTEAVIREIELSTPYKVVSSPTANSQLLGRIVSDSKIPLVENQYDEPRDIEFGLVVEITWQDYRGNLLRTPVAVPMPASLVVISQTADFIPEGGQSLTSAQHEAMRRMARQIVGQMELAW